jgi:CysZ protein
VALVLYLIFTPLAPILFWVVNGILLGREYAQLVALRRIGRGRGRRVPQASPAHDLRRRRADGVPLTIPVVNLLVPILGAATFTHLYHRLSRTGGAQPEAA